jgi:anaerobic magnesium-protoporphyrin IX monomethyl ester cyclase
MRGVAGDDSEKVDLFLLNPSLEIDHPQEMFYKSYEMQEEQLNLGLAALAAYLRERGVSFKIVDSSLERLSVEETVGRIGRSSFHGLGFSLNIYNLGPAVRIIKELRQAGFRQHVTAGGAFASLYAELLFSDFPFFDSIIYGDGVAAASELALNLRNGRDWRLTRGIIYRGKDGGLIKNPPVRVTADLDMLPRPLRYGGTGVQPVELARGCYGSCSFCALRAFYGLSGDSAPRRRSLRSFFDEVEELYGGGCRDFSFQADNFFPSADSAVADGYLDAFVREMRRRGLELSFYIACRADDITARRLRALKACGLAGLFVGVESINASELEAFGKGLSVGEIRCAVSLLRAYNVNFDCGYIFFSPWTTVPDLIRSADFMLEVGLEHFSYGAYRMKAHVGTKALQDIQAAGLSEKTPVLSKAGIETLYHQYRFQDAGVSFIWEHADALYRKIYAFILENALDAYKARNDLTRPKIISDYGVLGLIVDLAGANLADEGGRDALARERSAHHFRRAHEAVLSDLEEAAGK